MSFSKAVPGIVVAVVVVIVVVSDFVNELLSLDIIKYIIITDEP